MPGNIFDRPFFPLHCSQGLLNTKQGDVRGGDRARVEEWGLIFTKTGTLFHLCISSN
jgi:hypothetical protein